MDRWEQELKEALGRRPAPPSLKRRIVDAARRERAARRHSRAVVWQRLAAVLVLGAAVSGGFAWRHAEEERRGEEARQQLMTALRITNRALNDVRVRLAAKDRAAEQ